MENWQALFIYFLCFLLIFPLGWILSWFMYLFVHLALGENYSIYRNAYRKLSALKPYPLNRRRLALFQALFWDLLEENPDYHRFAALIKNHFSLLHTSAGGLLAIPLCFLCFIFIIPLPFSAYLNDDIYWSVMAVVWVSLAVYRSFSLLHLKQRIEVFLRRHEKDFVKNLLPLF